MSLQHEPCRGCGVVTEPYWRLAERRYCRACITRAGGADLGSITHPLVEEVRLSFLRGLMTSVWSGFVLAGAFAAFGAAFFFAINMFMQLSKDPTAVKDWLRLLLVRTPLFAGFAFAFSGIIAFPVALIMGWCKRPRRISIDADAFLVETAFKTARLPYTECVWSLPRLANDGTGYHLPGQRLLEICSTDLHRNLTRFACGFTEETFRIWKTFAALQGIPFKEKTPLSVWVVWIVGGAVAGGTIGSLVGAITYAPVGKPIWLATLGFIGFCDGGVWGGMRTLIGNMPLVSLRAHLSNRTMGWAVYRAIYPMAGFSLGLRFGHGAGLAGGIATGAANAVVWAWIGWNCSTAIHERLQTAETFPSELVR